MKYLNRFLLIAGCCWASVAVCCGCAALKEAGKGFAGVSTKVLEEGRPSAVKKSFLLDHDRCYLEVKKILSQKDKESPIYAQDPEGRMIAVYLASSDTTPVGIFFTPEANASTLIEISSPSIYAKEEIAGRIFSGLDALIKLQNPGKEN